MCSLPVDFALEYAELGYRVVPLTPGGNTPDGELLGTGWQMSEIGSSNPDQIRSWWGVKAGCNIGIAMGARSGIVVIDVDRKHGDGWASLWAWQEENGHLPETRISRTPSGGGHFWFRLPPGRDVAKKAPWLEHVDFIGTGMQAAVPPSIRKVSIRAPEPWAPPLEEWREYEWVNDLPLATAPEFLLRDIETRPSPVRRVNGEGEAGGGDRLPPTEEFLKNGLGWFTGSRNQDCFRLAFRLYWKNHTDREVAAVIMSCLDRTPARDHPFSAAEALKTAASARSRCRGLRDMRNEQLLEIMRSRVR